MSSRLPTAMRPIVSDVGGLMLVLLALVLSIGATYVRDSKHLVPGISTAQDVLGTCHNDHDYFEVELTTAELTPAVSCNGPHTSEVVWTVQLTGIVAEQHDRPTPEMLSGQYRGSCGYSRLAGYVGADPRGFLYNLTVDIRYPSAPEWRAGLRTARCIAGASYHEQPVRPTLDFPLKNSWHTKASAVIRLCATSGGSFFLPCDRPHTQEVLEPVNPFPSSQQAFPSAALSLELGRKPCTRLALDLLGRSTLPPGLRVIVEPAEPQNWPRSHDVGCRIESASRTGTLAAGLR